MPSAETVPVPVGVVEFALAVPVDCTEVALADGEAPLPEMAPTEEPELVAVELLDTELPTEVAAEEAPEEEPVAEELAVLPEAALASEEVEVDPEAASVADTYLTEQAEVVVVVNAVESSVTVVNTVVHTVEYAA